MWPPKDRRASVNGRLRVGVDAPERARRSPSASGGPWYAARPRDERERSAPRAGDVSLGTPSPIGSLIAVNGPLCVTRAGDRRPQTGASACRSRSVLRESRTNRSERLHGGSPSGASVVVSVAGRRQLGRDRRSGQSPAGLDGEDLVEPALVARLAAERRRRGRRPRTRRPARTPMTRAPEGQHVHVVVLDALVRGVRVVADGRADAADLVGGDARADARAADEDAAVRLAAGDRQPEPLGEVRVVVGRVRAVAAQVDPLVVEPGDRQPRAAARP